MKEQTIPRIVRKTVKRSSSRKVSQSMRQAVIRVLQKTMPRMTWGEIPLHGAEREAQGGQGFGEGVAEGLIQRPQQRAWPRSMSHPMTGTSSATLSSAPQAQWLGAAG